MNHAAHELLGAYAIGAVDAGERRTVERACDADPRLAALLDELERVVAAIDEHVAWQAGYPGWALWSRIQGEIGPGGP